MRITCPGIATATSPTPEAAGLRAGRRSASEHRSRAPRRQATSSDEGPAGRTRRDPGRAPASRETEDAALTRILAALDAALAPEALLLDLDGVIADVRNSYDRAILATAARWGVEATAADIERQHNAGRANDDFEVTRRLLAAAGIEATAQEIARRFSEVLEREELWRHERALLPPRRLAAWGRCLPLAVVTGRPRREAVRFLERSGLATAISALVCREDAPLKPDPQPVRMALAILGLTRAWMVGDTPDDVAAARRAGVVPIGIVPPGADVPATERALLTAGAACVLCDLQDLEDLLP